MSGHPWSGRWRFAVSVRAGVARGALERGPESTATPALMQRGRPRQRWNLPRPLVSELGASAVLRLLQAIENHGLFDKRCVDCPPGYYRAGVLWDTTILNLIPQLTEPCCRS